MHQLIPTSDLTLSHIYVHSSNQYLLSSYYVLHSGLDLNILAGIKGTSVVRQFITRCPLSRGGAK